MSTITVGRGRLDAAPSSSLKVTLAAAAGLSLILVLASAYRALPERAAATDAPVAAVAASDRVTLVVAGIPAEITPGTAVPVAGPVSAHISLARVAGRLGARDLHILLTDAAGAPIDGASLAVNGQMRYMDHGAFDATPQADGAGAYTAHLVFAMPGEYELRLTVTAAGSTGSLLLDLDLPN